MPRSTGGALAATEAAGGRWPVPLSGSSPTKHGRGVSLITRALAFEGARMIEPMLTDLALRGCATAVSCRAASCTGTSRGPAHASAHYGSLLCILHIGGSNLKSRATCDSPVLLVPRSHRDTDAPAPSGERRCRMHPEHCHRLQAEAIRGL
jgi:hypothetical protein